MNKEQRTKILIFCLIWLVFFSVGSITVYLNSNISLVFSKKVVTVNFFQRILGLTAYSLLFVQIILGAFMPFWRKQFGSIALNIHITNGLIAYTLVVLHPLMWVLINYLVRSKIDPYFPFIDVCLLCKNWQEWVYNFGRIGFWFITIAVTAGLFRGYNRFMALNWRKFHYLNYVAFISLYVHSLGIGSDVGTMPFTLIHGPALFIVVGVIAFKLFKFVKAYRSGEAH